MQFDCRSKTCIGCIRDPYFAELSPFFPIRAKTDFLKHLNDQINEKNITYARVSTPMYHQENRNLLKVWYSKTGLIFYSTLKRNKPSIEAFFSK